MRKRICALLLAVLLLAALPLPVFARETVDLSRTDCSITMEIKYGGKYLKGGSFSCTKVADVICDNGSDFFLTYLEGKEYRESLPNTADVETRVKNNPAFFSTRTKTAQNTTGIVTFRNLTPGLYLIRQTASISGYTNLSPFLVTVPYKVNGTYIYEVNAAVKTELEQEPTTPPPTTPSTPNKPKLPQTGQLNWPVPLMAASGLTLFVTGWFLVFRKKRDPYEN